MFRDKILGETENKMLLVSAMGVDSNKKSSMSVHLHNINPIPELDVHFEEADVRMIPHALHATNQGTNIIVFISNDTDVMVLALHFWSKLKGHGLKEMWICTGVVNSTRYIPLHILAKRL